jgi:hypothetical protein
MDESERRKMERFDLKLPARLTLSGNDKDHEPIELMTLNICAGGAYLITDNPLPKGTHVAMDLILKLNRLKKLRGKPSRIDVSGSVIRTDQQGMAICFDKEYRISPYSTIDY